MSVGVVFTSVSLKFAFDDRAVFEFSNRSFNLAHLYLGYCIHALGYCIQHISCFYCRHMRNELKR